MVEVQRKQILVDGTPRLLISGEIHYFRLHRADWPDRIARLKAAGGNTVASYIPWLCHELEDGSLDLDGHSRPELDLGAFIDLVHEQGLYFVARPGPFIMAEMKNEGIPYRLYEEHPEIVPVGWDGTPAPTRTLDYLAPAFLHETRRWYEGVMPVIAQRLQPEGGNVVAVQLDNEIGMLSWVSNSPDLTDHLLVDFWSWLGERKTHYPFAGEDEAARNAAIRSPEASWSADLMRDLGHYMRDRFARYVAALRSYAEEFGIHDVPFIVNIHGTEAGGGASFPIGISQLYESYTQAPGYLAGSDHYLGNLTAANGPDWYLMNAFMEAVNRPEQPLASVEFEAGSGDYGQSMGARLDPSAADFKLRMAIAQGNRLINYYLFTGGINYRLDRRTGDGNDRISFTGERHGTGAPVGPEGQLNYTYDRLARTNAMLLAFEDTLATMDEERDDLAMAFIPDYFMTESVYRGNPVMATIADNLRANRFGGPGQATIRALQQLTFRYTAVDVQNRPLDVATTPVLVLASARYMAAGIQEKLVAYLKAGGKLFLHGEVPLYDMTGADCTALLAALALEPATERVSTHRYFLSVNADGWAAPRPELRVERAQTFRPLPECTLFRVYGADEACGFDIPVGAGRAIVLTCALPADLDFFQQAFSRLGAVAGLTHDNPERNIFLSSARNDAGERVVHALNLDGFDKLIHISEQGRALFGGRPVMLRARDGVMLPLDLDLGGGVRVLWSTAEIVARGEGNITLRLTGDADELALELPVGTTIVPDEAIAVATSVEQTHIRVNRRGTGRELLTIRWE
ncbi:MAG TPA: beta-galactosidase [Thermomicrobiales bacterium]|nr:beta-galactosidase [Thermomicrobiales bacterium]